MREYASGKAQDVGCRRYKICAAAQGHVATIDAVGAACALDNALSTCARDVFEGARGLFWRADCGAEWRRGTVNWS